MPNKAKSIRLLFVFGGLILLMVSLPVCNISAGEKPTSISSTTKRIAFYSHGIYVINSDGSSLMRITEPGTFYPAWSPDGQRLAYAAGSNAVYLINADRSDQTLLTQIENMAEAPAWSPNSQYIVFAAYTGDGSGSIYVMNVESAKRLQSGIPRRINKSGIDARKLIWSPDSREIAFFYRRDVDSPEEIAVMNVEEALALSDGTHWITLGEGYDPAWSSAGQQIAFVSERDGNNEIYVMSADGSNQTRLTLTSSATPAWSPTGQQIAFVSERDGNNEIYVMNADGSYQVNLTHNIASDGFPAWSPDGKQIAFVSNRDGNQEIYVMNADGSDQRRLTNTPEDEWDPVWAPQ
jgi:Tol biopolymer transport system component